MSIAAEIIARMSVSQSNLLRKLVLRRHRSDGGFHRGMAAARAAIADGRARACLEAALAASHSSQARHRPETLRG